MPGSPPAPRVRLSTARAIPLLLAITGLLLAIFALPQTGHAEYPDYPGDVPSTPTPTPTPGGSPGNPTPTPIPTRPDPAHEVHLQGIASDQGRLTTLPGIGCAGNVLGGGHTTLWFPSGGVMRSTVVRTPANAQAGKPMAMVLNFHAFASNGVIQEDLSGLAPIADNEGFLLVSPDGIGQPSGWNALLSNNSGSDDVRFVSDLIDEIEQQFCVDQHRIYAVGFSNGAMLASLVGCELGDRVAAVVAIAGAWEPNATCGRRAAILGVHGVNDDVVPFTGGMIIGQAQYLGPRNELAKWAASFHRCPEQVASQQISPGITLESYPGCDVSLLVLDHLGHAPPSGSTPDIMWAFLNRYRLP